MKALVHAGLSFEFCSQILIAPLITLVLLYWRRRSVFRDARGAYATGGICVLVAVSLYWFAARGIAISDSLDRLSMLALGVVLIWISGFYAAYGGKPLRAAAFPLGFLLFMIPIPTGFLNWSIFYLQWGTTAIAHSMFQLLGIPVLQRGFVLSMPGLSIEIAKECSSIRSSIALIITCLLAGFLFLRSAKNRTVLVLIALPLSILKNAIRVVTLSVLSMYVSPAFMRSDLHRDGGILFYLLALVLLFPVFRWLEKLERRGSFAHPSAYDS
ncbi:MAG: exosortase [Acidobacteriota bacterium]|nr:exosortase [Acidobacteriota bacterium]